MVNSKSGNFSVKSSCSCLEHEGLVSFLTDVIWNPWVPTRVSFFPWEAVWKGILTREKLMRSWNFVNRCLMWKGEEESIEQILLHWSKARILWHFSHLVFHGG